ncbi:MAG TPA: hypothetical protein VGM94_03770 [Galbitalea sp.]
MLFMAMGIVALGAPAYAGSKASDSAARASCAPDLVTEDGTCVRRLPSPPLTKADRQDLARTNTEIANLGSTDRSSTWSGTNVLPEVEQMHLLKEGQGDGGAWWTCGPSATRNLVSAMYKRLTGSYKDFGEQKIGAMEGTTHHGTARANVASALNKYFPRTKHFGPWITTRPSNAAMYFHTVAVTVDLKLRPLIANIDTEYLSYFGQSDGNGLDHFNLVYGSRTTTDGKVYLRVAEEWDPHRAYGMYANSAPYGKYWVPLSQAFNAINHTSIHGIVR